MDNVLIFGTIHMVSLLGPAEIASLSLYMCKGLQGQNSEVIVFILKNHVELIDGFRVLGKMFIT